MFHKFSYSYNRSLLSGLTGNRIQSESSTSRIFLLFCFSLHNLHIMNLLLSSAIGIHNRQKNKSAGGKNENKRPECRADKQYQTPKPNKPSTEKSVYSNPETCPYAPREWMGMIESQLFNHTFWWKRAKQWEYSLLPWLFCHVFASGETTTKTCITIAEFSKERARYSETNGEP